MGTPSEQSRHSHAASEFSGAWLTTLPTLNDATAWMLARGSRRSVRALGVINPRPSSGGVPTDRTSGRDALRAEAERNQELASALIDAAAAASQPIITSRPLLARFHSVI